MASPIIFFDNVFTILSKVTFENYTFEALHLAFTFGVWTACVTTFFLVAAAESVILRRKLCFQGFQKNCFENFAIIIGETVKKEKTPILAIWMLASLILTHCYNGLVCATLAKLHPIYYDSFDTIAGRKVNSFVLNVSWKMLIDTYFNHSKTLTEICGNRRFACELH